MGLPCIVDIFSYCICAKIIIFAKFYFKMKNQHNIKHVGIVTRINGNNKVIVKITQNSACSVCDAKGACSAADKAEKEIEAVNLGKMVEVGQEVTITGQTTQGLQAAFLAYFLPFIVLITTLIVVFYSTKNEGIAAMSAIASLVPYYFILFLFKNKLTKKFTFYIN